MRLKTENRGKQTDRKMQIQKGFWYNRGLALLQRDNAFLKPCEELKCCILTPMRLRYHLPSAHCGAIVSFDDSIFERLIPTSSKASLCLHRVKWNVVLVDRAMPSRLGGDCETILAARLSWSALSARTTDKIPMHPSNVLHVGSGLKIHLSCPQAPNDWLSSERKTELRGLGMKWV